MDSSKIIYAAFKNAKRETYFYCDDAFIAGVIHSASHGRVDASLTRLALADGLMIPASKAGFERFSREFIRSEVKPLALVRARFYVDAFSTIRAVMALKLVTPGDWYSKKPKEPKAVAADPAEQIQPSEPAADTSTMSVMQAQIEALQAQLLGMKQAITKSPAAHATALRAPDKSMLALQTIEQIWAWLALQDRLPIATLRVHLLPLDLLPSAVIDDLNELALDLTGEPALAEVGDVIVVTRDILTAVLADQNRNRS